MLTRLVQRILFALATLFGAGLLVALLLSLVPDYYIKSDTITRFIENFTTFITLDFGDKEYGSFPILQVLAHRGLQSLSLMTGAIVLTFVVGVPLGALSAVKRDNRLLTVCSATFSALSSLPVLVWAFSLIFIFMRWLDFLPTMDALEHSHGVSVLLIYFLPIFVLAIGDGMLADVIRSVHNETIRIMEQDYMHAVRARNVSQMRHLTKSLLVPILAIFSSRTTYLISGTIVVEYIFNWKGLGFAIWQAVSTSGAKNYPFILAATMLFVAIVILLNLLSEIGVLIVDPRLRRGAPVE